MRSRAGAAPSVASADVEIVLDMVDMRVEVDRVSVFMDISVAPAAGTGRRAGRTTVKRLKYHSKMKMGPTPTASMCAARSAYCTETGPSTGVFARRWTGATVVWDCNARHGADQPDVRGGCAMGRARTPISAAAR